MFIISGDGTLTISIIIFVIDILVLLMCIASLILCCRALLRAHLLKLVSFTICLVWNFADNIYLSVMVIHLYVIPHIIISYFCLIYFFIQYPYFQQFCSCLRFIPFNKNNKFLVTFRPNKYVQNVIQATTEFVKNVLGCELMLSDQLEFLNFWYVMIVINDVCIICGTLCKITIEFRVGNFTCYCICSFETSSETSSQ